MLRADTLARWYATTVFRPKNLEIFKKKALAICNYYYSFKNIGNGHSTRCLCRHRGEALLILPICNPALERDEWSKLATLPQGKTPHPQYRRLSGP